MIDTSTGNALAVTRACLAAIKKHDRNVNAMITVTEENAIRQAEAADEAARNARWLGLLHGMPIAIKDNIATAGVRTTAGSPFFADHMPNENAAVTQRLLNAGAIIVGKAPMMKSLSVFDPTTRFRGNAAIPGTEVAYRVGRVAVLERRWQRTCALALWVPTPADRCGCRRR